MLIDGKRRPDLRCVRSFSFFLSVSQKGRGGQQAPCLTVMGCCVIGVSKVLRLITGGFKKVWTNTSTPRHFTARCLIYLSTFFTFWCTWITDIMRCSNQEPEESRIIQNVIWFARKNREQKGPLQLLPRSTNAVPGESEVGVVFWTAESPSISCLKNGSWTPHY